MAGLGHLLQAEIDAVGEQDGQQADPVAAGAPVRRWVKASAKPVAAIDLEQEVGDRGRAACAVEIEHEVVGAVRRGSLQPVEMEDAVLDRGTGERPARAALPTVWSIRARAAVRLWSQRVRVERHGEARRRSRTAAQERELVSTLAISPAVRQPDVAGPQGIAELEEDGSLPVGDRALPLYALAAISAARRRSAPQPPRVGYPAVKGAENVDCTRRDVAAWPPQKDKLSRRRGAYRRKRAYPSEQGRADQPRSGWSEPRPVRPTSRSSASPAPVSTAVADVAAP